MKKMCLLNTVHFGLLVCVFSLVPAAATGAPIVLQNGTATFSQLLGGGPYSPSQAIDGNFGDPNGWAIAA